MGFCTHDEKRISKFPKIRIIAFSDYNGDHACGFLTIVTHWIRTLKHKISRNLVACVGFTVINFNSEAYGQPFNSTNFLKILLQTLTRFHILQRQAPIISSYKVSHRWEFTFIFLSLHRGDDWRVIKQSSTFWDYICKFFNIAINHNFSSLTEEVWLTDWQN